jgi:hypothetical protein
MTYNHTLGVLHFKSLTPESTVVTVYTACFNIKHSALFTSNVFTFEFPMIPVNSINRPVFLMETRLFFMTYEINFYKLFR